MALNPLYMISPNLQEYFVDKDSGLPLAGGLVTYYSDNDRETLKPVYELVKVGTDYTFVVLPNPLTLSATGTTMNEAGKDVRVYYYPHDADLNPENYYITVQSSVGVPQLTREAWPNVSSSTSTAFAYNFVRNYNFFSWSNSTLFSNVKTGSVDQYDFFVDDWTFEQDDASQTIEISRGSFSIGDDSVPNNPAYYLIYKNTNAGNASSTYNRFRQRYKSVQTLSGQNVSCSIYVRQQVGDSLKPLSVTLTQFYGTGSLTSPVDTTVILVPVLTTSTGFMEYHGSVTLPIATGNIGSANDDALILSINNPINSVREVHYSNVILEQGPSVSGSQEISNDDTKRNTDTIGLYPPFSCGDVKFTLKTVADPGWLMMDDGTIGNPSSGASHIGWATYSLYQLIWNNVNSAIWAPIYDSSGVLTTYGGTAVDDWMANKRLSLTKALGRVLSGSGTGSITRVFTVNLISSNKKLFLTGANYQTSFYVGTPVLVATNTGSLPSGLLPFTTYYVTNINNSDPSIQLSTTLANAVAGNADVTLASAGTGTQYTVIAFLPTQIFGSFLGQATHSITISELPSHTHDIQTSSTTGAAGKPLSAQGSNPNVATQATGGNTAMNIIQPTTFMNVMIKL